MKNIFFTIMLMTVFSSSAFAIGPGTPLTAEEVKEIKKNQKLIVGAWSCNVTTINPGGDASGKYVIKNERKTYGDIKGTREFGILTFEKNGRISTGPWAGSPYKFAVYDNGKDFPLGVYWPRYMSFGIEKGREYYPSSGERIIYYGYKIHKLTATEFEFSRINDSLDYVSYHECEKSSGNKGK